MSVLAANEAEVEAVGAVTPMAFKRRAAAAFLGCSETKLWYLVNLPEGDPRRIRRTSYGTYPRVELERHLAAELGDHG